MPAKPRQPEIPKDWHYQRSPFYRCRDELTFSTGEQRERWLDFLTGEYQQEFFPTETLPRLRRWMDSYFQPDPVDFRFRIGMPRLYTKILQSVHEAFAMTLGGSERMIDGVLKGPIAEYWEHYHHPEFCYPPLQADFDRRAAEWLRLVITLKDVPKLKYLIAALEMIPCELTVGMDPQKIYDSLPRADSEFHMACSVYDELGKWFEANRNLPSKKELREAVDRKRLELSPGARPIDIANWTKTLEDLGLNGLPEHGRRE